MSQPLKRWRGLATLLGDVVEHGASAIERVHLATSQRTFTLLEHIPLLAAPAHAVNELHDVAVSAVYSNVRLVARGVAKTLELGLDLAESRANAASPALTDNAIDEVEEPSLGDSR